MLQGSECNRVTESTHLASALGKSHSGTQAGYLGRLTCPNDPGVPGNVAGRLALGCLVQKGVVMEKCQVYKGL